VISEITEICGMEGKLFFLKPLPVERTVFCGLRALLLKNSKNSIQKED
jgi:hypothetical protein